MLSPVHEVRRGLRNPSLSVTYTSVHVELAYTPSFATFFGQVLPVFSPRLAVTLWFYGRQLGIPARSDAASSSARSGCVPLLSPPSLKPEKLAPGDDTRANVRPLPLDSSGGGHAQEVRAHLSWKFGMFNLRGDICSAARV